MAQTRWQKLVDDLLRLAQDDGATEDERATARLKLAQVMENHPHAQEIRQYKPVQEFTLGDLRRMRQQGISTAGHWEGQTLEEAMYLMVSDYGQRLAAYRPQPKAIELLARTVSFADVGAWIKEIDQELAELQ